MTVEPTLSTTEASERLGISPDRVRALINSGRLQARTEKGNHRILESSIDRYLAGDEQNSPASGRTLDDVARLYQLDLAKLPKLLTAAEAASLLNEPVWRIRQMIAIGTIPVVHISQRRSKIPAIAILRLLAGLSSEVA